MSALCLHILESDSSSTQIPAETVSRLGKTKARGLFMQRGTSPSRGAHDYRRVCALNANAAAPGPSQHTSPHARAGRQRGEGCGKPGPAARPGGAGEPGGPRCPAPPRPGPREEWFIYLPAARAAPCPSSGRGPRPAPLLRRVPSQSRPGRRGKRLRRTKVPAAAAPRPAGLPAARLGTAAARIAGRPGPAACHSHFP